MLIESLFRKVLSPEVEILVIESSAPTREPPGGGSNKQSVLVCQAVENVLDPVSLKNHIIQTKTRIRMPSSVAAGCQVIQALTNDST